MSKSIRTASAAQQLLDADKAASHRAARSRRTAPARIAGWLAEVADQPPLIALSIGIGVVGLASGRRDLARAGARMLAAHLLATKAKDIVKHMVDRARPAHALDTGDERFEPGGSDDHDLTSFPSGHTAGAVAVARAAAHEIDGVALPATFAVGAVAAAQPVAGHHYISDTLVGGAIGWAAEALVGAVFERWDEARRTADAQARQQYPVPQGVANGSLDPIRYLSFRSLSLHVDRLTDHGADNRPNSNRWADSTDHEGEVGR